MSEIALQILLVEDHTATGTGTRDLLALKGANVIVHSTHMRDAIATVVGQRFDAVLLDASSPSDDGPAAVARFHAAVPDVPIILLSGAEDALTRVRALQEGAQDVLTKGDLTAGALIRTIRDSIERKRVDENGRRLIREQAARAEAESSEKRARVLAGASRALASPLEIEVTLQNVASHVIGFLGDGCVFDLLEDGGEIRCVAVAHVAVDIERKIRETRAHVSAQDALEHPVLKAMLRKEPAVLRKGELSPDLRTLFAGAIVPSEAIVVPLAARGKILGAVTFFGTGMPRPFAEQDVALAVEIGVRAALAVDIARLYRAREDTLSVVSHDLRNRLNVISVACTALGLSTVPEVKKASYLDKIGRAADRMNRIIQDLLDVSRIEAGSVTFEWGLVSVTALVTDALEMMRPLAEAKSISLTENVVGVLPELRADRGRLLQLFSNILGNAIKFTPVGGTISVSAAPSSDGVRFCVHDSGPGILDAYLTKIFDRYWQARRSDRSGVGLGLAIAKGIVHAHSGEIWAESHAGEGASFFVTLPFSGEARSSAPSETRLHFTV